MQQVDWHIEQITVRHLNRQLSFVEATRFLIEQQQGGKDKQ